MPRTMMVTILLLVFFLFQLVQPVFGTEKCSQICETDTRYDLILQILVISRELKLWIAAEKHKF